MFVYFQLPLFLRIKTHCSRCCKCLQKPSRQLKTFIPLVWTTPDYQQKRDRRRTPKWEQCHRTLTRLRATNVNVRCVLYLLQFTKAQHLATFYSSRCCFQCLHVCKHRFETQTGIKKRQQKTASKPRCSKNQI